MTKHHPKLIREDVATNVFIHLRDNIEWEDGVPSKKGFTRKAKPMQFGDDPVLDFIIFEAFEKLEINSRKLQFIYLNYYRDGEDWCPVHTHPGTKQMIISLGTVRQLLVGTKEYPMGNGDVIIFGASGHGIAKDPQCKEARIAIALFLDK